MKGEKIKYRFNALRRDVMKALCLTKLSGRDFRILLFILGQTDGYHRSQDKIKPAFFVERTGLDKSNIRVTIARLRKLHMIVKSGSFYTVLPPDQWDKGIFIETQMCINIDAELPPSGEEKRIKSDAFGASNPMRPELKSDAVLASPIENSSIENLTIENQALKKSPDPLNEFRKRAFDGLKERRGTISPVPGAEAKAITWMLNQGYSVEQILNAYDKLKKEKFWADQFLNMQSVKKQIGEIFKKGRQGGAHQQRPRGLLDRDRYHLPGESEEEYRARMALRDN